MSTSEMVWLGVGFAGQLVFTARFLVQWIASERQGRSVIPLAFWYLSLAGSWLLLCYAIYRQDPVIIVGQLFGVLVYGRNLTLIHRRHRDREPDFDRDDSSIRARPSPSTSTSSRRAA